MWVPACGGTLGSDGESSKLSKNGRKEEVLLAMAVMDQQGIPLSKDTIYGIVQDCTKNKDLATGRHVHSIMVSCGLDSIAFLGDHLIRLFTSCGGLLEASQVFCKVSKPSVYTWNAIISAYVNHGDNEMALALYKKMQEADTIPDKVTFLFTLKACSSMEIIEQGRLIHDQIIRNELLLDEAVGSSIIDMYAKCGCLEDARMVFDELSNQNVVSWSAMIAGYAQQCNIMLVLEYFGQMQQKGINPSKVTYLHTLKACGSTAALLKGRLMHEDILRSGLESDLVIGSALLDMYAKCESLEEARKVFDRLPTHDLVSWCAMITGYVQHGHGHCALELFEKMQNNGLKPDKVAFSSILKACGSLGAVGQGMLIHDQIIMRGIRPDVVVGSSLVDMYAKCGSLQEALKVFNEVPNRNSVSWGALIAGYVQHGNSAGALDLFVKMQDDGIKPSKLMFLCIMKACSAIGALQHGRLIHAQITDSGLKLDVVIGSTLVDMYSKCGSLEEAWTVFGKLQNRDVVSWGAIISGCAQHDHRLCALACFERMQQEGIQPSKVTFVSILKACSGINTISQGKLIHDQVIRSGLESDAIIESSLVDMYAKCQSLEDSQKVFESSSNQDVVSWAARIAGYALHGYDVSALQLFERMQQEGTDPSTVMFLCIFKACGGIGAVGQCRLMHDRFLRGGLEWDVVVGSAIVDMYAKCGIVEDARKVFDELPNRNVVSWGAVIAGYAWRGNCKLVWQCLEDMQRQGLRPVETIFTSILAACSYAGLLEEGCQHFKAMIENHGIMPTIEHYNCMVDLLGRAGCLTEAEDFLLTVPFLPDIIAWTSLLASSRTHGNIKLAKRCFDGLIQLDPSDASGYMLMSNIYTDAYLWESLDTVQKLKHCISAEKMPGMAWVEVSNHIHEFTVGASSHPQSDGVEAKLKSLTDSIKVEGYWPRLDLVSKLVTERDQE